MKFTLFILLASFSFLTKAQSVSVLTDSNKGDSLFTIGEYNNAIPYFLKANRFRDAAKSYEKIGSYSSAEHYYKKTITKNNSNPVPEFEYAKMLVKISNFKLADSILQNLHSRFPNNPNFLYERGLVKELQNDSTSIDLFLQVYSMDKGNINASYKIARNYVENRKFAEAVPFIENGLLVDKNSSRFLTLRALKEFHTKEYHKTIDTYNILISNGHSYISLHENLADAYTQTMQFEKAIDQYSILFKNYDDQNPKWHHEVAILYRAMKEIEQAKKHLNIAIGLLETPLSNEYLELATIHKREGDYKNEMAALKKALANNPYNEMALYNLAVAADNYYKDKKTILKYYENYLNQFGEKGIMRNLGKQRISDLKKEIHFKTD
ncbi:tetratricopeptide repeat protein [Aequorivita sediminis]|uniref:tetratricopeptide repeat protein n=1 Tax=Aequorivita sediminis TaxID=3073653 RepID=UPI0028A6CAFF|nr:hypothetical protein [Aequorivita sp. F6058]